VGVQKAIVKVHDGGYNNLIPSVQWNRDSILISHLHLNVLTDPVLEPLADGR